GRRERTAARPPRRRPPRRGAAQPRPPDPGSSARASSSSSSPSSRFPPLGAYNRFPPVRVTTQELWHAPEASQGLEPLLGLPLCPGFLVRPAHQPVVAERASPRLRHARQEPLPERRIDALDDLAHGVTPQPVKGNDPLGVFARRGAVVEAAGGHRLAEYSLGSERVEERLQDRATSHHHPLLRPGLARLVVGDAQRSAPPPPPPPHPSPPYPPP